MPFYFLVARKMGLLIPIGRAAVSGGARLAAMGRESLSKGGCKRALRYERTDSKCKEGRISANNCHGRPCPCAVNALNPAQSAGETDERAQAGGQIRATDSRAFCRRA